MNNYKIRCTCTGRKPLALKSTLRLKEYRINAMELVDALIIAGNLFLDEDPSISDAEIENVGMLTK